MPNDRRPRTAARKRIERDTARMDAAKAELDASIAAARRTTARVQQFTADVEADKIPTDHVVLDPFEDEDTLVQHLRDAIRAPDAPP